MSLKGSLQQVELLFLSTNCSIGLLFVSLSNDDAQTLRDAIRNRVPLSRIKEALRLEGHSVSTSALQRHRAGACQCEPT